MFSTLTRVLPLKTLHLVLSLSYALLPPFTSYSSPGKREAKLAFLLNQQSTIRVYVPSAAGNGHQSASVNVVRRLRELGFTGLIQIVYRWPEKSKLRYLFPPFDSNGPNRQEFPEKNIVFGISYTLGKARIAILGAGYAKGTDYSFEYLLRLSPYSWTQFQDGTYPEEEVTSSPLSIEVIQLHLDQLVGREYEELDREKLYIFKPVTELETNAGDFLRREMGHTLDLKGKIPGLKSLIENLEHYDLMPIYGMSWNHEKLIWIVQTLVDAVRQRPDLFNRGIVLPLISGFRENRIKRLIASNHLQDHVSYTEVGDPALKRHLEQATRHRKILLYQVGNVSMHVFEYLMSKSTLPPTVAGVNGRNLLRLLGIPFLNVDPTSKEGLDLAPETAAQFPVTTRLIKRVRTQLHDGGKKTSTPTPDLKKFFVQAKTEGSKLRQLYKKSKDETIRNGNDIVIAGLESLFEILEEDSPPSCSTALSN